MLENGRPPAALVNLVVISFSFPSGLLLYLHDRSLQGSPHAATNARNTITCAALLSRQVRAPSRGSVILCVRVSYRAPGLGNAVLDVYHTLSALAGPLFLNQPCFNSAYTAPWRSARIRKASGISINGSSSAHHHRTDSATPRPSGHIPIAINVSFQIYIRAAGKSRSSGINKDEVGGGLCALVCLHHRKGCGGSE
ncbi:hypothetical protein C8Q76DRAFT_751186 [Earliella scabrosa]|nr:hypothetical protein C8Q76DRAFT_751186 [Earliella scabrosa]